MDYIKLAQRTITMLSSMIESGECHTTRSKEMKDNALNGLEQLRLHSVSNCVATEYAEFCVRCDREKLPLLCLEDYIKQYCG